MIGGDVAWEVGMANLDSETGLDSGLAVAPFQNFNEAASKDDEGGISTYGRFGYERDDLDFGEDDRDQSFDERQLTNIHITPITEMNWNNELAQDGILTWMHSDQEFGRDGTEMRRTGFGETGGAGGNFDFALRENTFLEEAFPISTKEIMSGFGGNMDMEMDMEMAMEIDMLELLSPSPP
jgi:hypothetical protein